MATILPYSEVMHDETPVNLTPDQIEVVKKKLGELKMSMDSLVESLNSGSFTISNRNAICGCIENWASQLTQATGHDSDIERRKKESSNALRTANIEIHRLEQLVGSQRGFDGVPELMSSLSRTVHDYWDKMGFSLVQDNPHHKGGFTARHGNLYYRATCTTMLDEFRCMEEDKPVTSEQRRKDFVENMALSLDLAGDGDSKSRLDSLVLDTPSNRKHIEEALAQRFPSMWIEAWDIRRIVQNGEHKGKYYIRQIEISISKCEELLPTEEEEADTEAKRRRWEEGKTR